MRKISVALLILAQWLFFAGSSFGEKSGETNEKLGAQAFAHATSLIRAGKYAEAADELKKCTGVNDSAPHKSLIMQAIAECYVSLKDWPGAIKAYEDLIQTPYSHYDPNIINSLAKVYGLAGLNDKASAERKMALRYGYADPDNVVSRCESATRKGNLMQAIAMAEYAQSTGDHNLALSRFLARAYTQQGSFDRGMKEISDCCKTGDLCAENFGIKGELEFNLGHYADAISDLDTAIRLPLNPAALGQKTPDAQIRHWQYCRVGCLFRMKKYPEALKSVNALIAERGGKPDSFLLTERGLIYSSTNNYDKAISDFTQAIALDSVHPALTAYQSRRETYCVMKNFNAARADAEKVISLTPTNPEGYLFLSMIDMRQRNYKKAVEGLNEAIKRNSNKMETLYLECRADAHYQAADYPASVADYTDAIAIDAAKPWLLAGRALSYSRSGSPDKANKDLASLRALKSKQSVKPDRQPGGFLETSISDRRELLIMAASKLKPV